MEPLGGITGAVNYGTTVPTVENRAADTRRQDTPAAVDTAQANSTRLPEDTVTLSGQQPGSNSSATATNGQTSTTAAKPAEKTTDGQSLDDPQVKEQIARLKQTEEKVKAHEAAHKSAGGGLAGSASYSYTQGPDGRSYVTGGEVQINMSDGRTPAETIARMQQVIQAALAPSDPSGQDRSVAAQAASRMAQAQQEKLQGASTTGNVNGQDSASSSQNATQATGQTAVNPATDTQTTNTNSSRIQQAYGNPAVQGAAAAANTTSGKGATTGASSNDTFRISSFA